MVQVSRVDAKDQTLGMASWAFRTGFEGYLTDSAICWSLWTVKGTLGIGAKSSKLYNYHSSYNYQFTAAL